MNDTVPPPTKLASVGATEISDLGPIAVMIIWIMFALGAGAPVAVFIVDIVGIVVVAVILTLGALVVGSLVRDGRATRRMRAERRARLDDCGVTVRGVVLTATRPELGLVGIGDRLVVKLQLELDGGDTRRRDIECLVDLIEIPRVQPGCVIGLRSDPDDPTNYEVELPVPRVAS